MKKLAYGFAAAALLAGIHFAVPANAMTAPPAGAAATSETVQVRYFHHHRRVCTVRTIVKRGYHGRRIVKRVRVCR
ncbi:MULTISPECIES: hypothetical protein [unclassified Bradyrhizobium]|uniref:hypothetical protein n=1 Tax=unclassified Bradyrhizobium TaxID=2631580 RepID=UPI001FF7E286|nr:MULTISPECIES: hypothetical protein [unclassified Bradyrhizobium]MCK1306585.1 hypothetical protein [Bradyrhizobium sp. 45]MCK1435445.1 hypothetical protein [Bradyrhizobium sp. 15]MCK1456738.1 hypothetical protein [Bradyrhizobium sp. 35]MCK1611584.1 hypothetical protein [Bradyrhizobium sp. 163]MCK1761743.1 hypothetical protein [Bradyrhizobium sp. 136]